MTFVAAAQNGSPAWNISNSAVTFFAENQKIILAKGLRISGQFEPAMSEFLFRIK